MQLLLWKVTKGVLPVKSNMVKRKVMSSDECMRCGCHKSENQLIFQCPFARQVWKLAPSQHRLNVDTFEDVKAGIKSGKRCYMDNKEHEIL